MWPRRRKSQFPRPLRRNCRVHPAVESLEERLAPAAVRFAAIGDYGLSSQPELDVAHLVASWNPDLIITLGDNNYQTGAAATIDANIGQYYHGFISPYKGNYGAGATTNRFFPTLGHHDWGYAFPNPNGDQPYLNYFTLPGNGRYYTFTQGSVQFFAIDSDPNEPDGTSSTSVQATWLKSQLAASTATWKIVYFHNPPYSSDSLGYMTPSMQWPFQAWGVTAVLGGHAHDYERLIEGGFPYFVNGLGGDDIATFATPVAGSQVRYNGDFGAMLINAADTQISFQFYSRAGTLIDSYAINTATHLGISTQPSNPTTGKPFGVTVTALDALGNLVPGYSGTVHISSSDPRGTLPADYTFTVADNGQHTFTATLGTAGSQTITATDTANVSLNGSATLTVTPPSVPAPDHVVIVVESWHGYADIIGNSAAPYINTLAQSGASFTNSHGLSSYGQPNYLALFSGSDQGVADNGTYTFTGPNLEQSLVAGGLSFVGYSESLPSVGYTGAVSGAYQRWHNPWVDFTNVPAAVNQPFSSFPTDYSQLPTVSFVIPNFNNDMHDGSVAAGDSWLQSQLGAYVQWASSHNSLLIVTWDHDSGTLSDQIPTLFVGPRVKAGNYGENISHYNVLRTVEDMYGLPYLAQDATASPITDVWNTGVPAKLSAATASPAAELATAVAHSAWADPRLTQWLQSAGSAGGVGSSPISGLPGGQGNVLPPSAPIQGVTSDKHGGPGGHARRPHKQKAKSVAKGRKSAGHRRGKVISPPEWSLRLPT